MAKSQQASSVIIKAFLELSKERGLNWFHVNEVKERAVSKYPLLKLGNHSTMVSKIYKAINAKYEYTIERERRHKEDYKAGKPYYGTEYKGSGYWYRYTRMLSAAEIEVLTVDLTRRENAERDDAFKKAMGISKEEEMKKKGIKSMFDPIEKKKEDPEELLITAVKMLQKVTNETKKVLDELRAALQ